MSRVDEVRCLSRIKEAVLNFRSFCHIECCNTDLSYLKEAFRTVFPNVKENEFPDFIFDGGVIEHFIVTGSKENKKGCEYKINENKVKELNKGYFKKKDDDFLNSPRNPGTITTASTENAFDNSSYSNFYESFIRNFNNHLDSLLKSSYIGKKIIFLIEQQDGRLGIHENNKFSEFYLLSRDKLLLQFLEEKSSIVNYVIFNASNSIEIIELSKISNLLSNAKAGLDIRGERITNISLKVYLDF